MTTGKSAPKKHVWGLRPNFSTTERKEREGAKSTRCETLLERFQMKTELSTDIAWRSLSVSIEAERG